LAGGAGVDDDAVRHRPVAKVAGHVPASGERQLARPAYAGGGQLSLADRLDYVAAEHVDVLAHESSV
jgi:hypothetical protein